MINNYNYSMPPCYTDKYIYCGVKVLPHSVNDVSLVSCRLEKTNIRAWQKIALQELTRSPTSEMAIGPPNCCLLL